VRHGLLGLVALCAAACGGGGGGGGGDGDATAALGPPAYPAPRVEFTIDGTLDTAVTDYAGCLERMLPCMKTDGSTRSCLASSVPVCAGEPDGTCCMQGCVDQMLGRIDGGGDLLEAFVEIMLKDVTCMPGIAELYQ
jgi:hypothetical protein